MRHKRNAGQVENAFSEALLTTIAPSFFYVISVGGYGESSGTIVWWRCFCKVSSCDRNRSVTLSFIRRERRELFIPLLSYFITPSLLLSCLWSVSVPYGKWEHDCMTGNTMRAIFHILRRFRRIAGHFVNKSWTPFEIIGILRVFTHQMMQPSAFNSFKPRPFVGLMHESVWRHFRLLFSINWCYLRQLVDYNGRPGSGRVIWRFQVNTLMISNEIMS